MSAYFVLVTFVALKSPWLSAGETLFARVCKAGTLSTVLNSLQTGRSKTTPWGSGYGKLPEGGRLHGACWVFRPASISWQQAGADLIL